MSATETAVAVRETTDKCDEEMDPALIRKNLYNLGKTFNNARHAYLSLNISQNSLPTINVSLFYNYFEWKKFVLARWLVLLKTITLEKREVQFEIYQQLHHFVIFSNWALQ